MQLIERYTHDAEGYTPFLIRPRWQVAILNYAPAEALGAIDKLDVHHLTDEVFVLLDGHSVLIAATVSDNIVSYQTADMQPGVVYNIPCGVWHKIAMHPGSKVLIVENPETHVGDFEFYELSAQQKAELAVAVNQAETNR